MVSRVGEEAIFVNIEGRNTCDFILKSVPR